MVGIRKITPWWISLLFCFGTVAFPVGRILRIEWIAHAADVLLLIPVIYIGAKFITKSFVSA
jgi:hypothetical protein